MYIYIMQRTQIYLSEQDQRLLEELARTSGRTKSQLIRDAIARAYLPQGGHERVLDALKRSAGAWKRRETGRAYVERLRRGRLARLHGAGE
jgi:predicted DNA-binding protein